MARNAWDQIGRMCQISYTDAVDSRPTLLFITQKLHGQDAFGVLWVRAFMERGYTVRVICLEKRLDDAERVLGRGGMTAFEVHSLGKEEGAGRLRQIRRFRRLIRTLEYDRVFIHMSPVWGLFGAPTWIRRRTPVYLWYTHYKMQAGLRLLARYGKRLFCATAQSLPQYEGNPKKIVVGHGIDLGFWPERVNTAADPYRLLAVHRLSRSKRVELILRAMTILPERYTLDVYGIEAEPDYVSRLRALVSELRLGARVRFHGTVAMKDLAALYISHRFILNMASETIDKTMLEAMTCGCYPVTTAANVNAIGLPSAPSKDTPETIARFVEEHRDQLPLSANGLYRIVAERHSLTKLIERMDHYIRPGL